MFDIGASLREARTRRGLSLDDVTTGLRIRERYVTALEEERWELMPAEAYTKGFLRMYAEFLGLNGTLYIDEYNERIAPHDDEPFIPESLAPTKRRTRLLFRTIVGLVGVAVAVAALNLLGSGSTTARHVQPDLSNVANAAPPKQPAAAPVQQHLAPAPASATRTARRSSAASSTAATPSPMTCTRTCGSASAGRSRSRSASACTSSAACRARPRTCC